MKLNKYLLKSFLLRPMIALQTTTCTRLVAEARPIPRCFHKDKWKVVGKRTQEKVNKRSSKTLFTPYQHSDVLPKPVNQATAESVKAITSLSALALMEVIIQVMVGFKLPHTFAHLLEDTTLYKESYHQTSLLLSSMPP